jgi:hypothetical protein
MVCVDERQDVVWLGCRLLVFACTPCPLDACVRGRVGNRFIRMH